MEALPTIACCMIARNAAGPNRQRFVELLRDDVRPYVEHLVIVHGGESRDETEEIARRYADVTATVPWTGMSDARNHALDLAGGLDVEWVVVVDADERIPNPAVFWQGMRTMMSVPEVGCIRIIGRSFFETDGQYDDEMQTRAWPNVPEIRYSGRVHNQIDPSVARHLITTNTHPSRCLLVVYHWGYTGTTEQQRAKFAPRLPMMREDYEGAETDSARAYYAYQLAVMHYTSGFPVECLSWWDEVRWDDLPEAFHAQGLMLKAKAWVAIYKDHRDAWDEESARYHALACLDHEHFWIRTHGARLLALAGDVGDALAAMVRAYLDRDERTLADCITAGEEVEQKLVVSEGAVRASLIAILKMFTGRVERADATAAEHLVRSLLHTPTAATEGGTSWLVTGMTRD